MVGTLKTDHGKFTDLIDSYGNVIKTAKSVYEGYLEQLEKANTVSKVKTLEELTKENEQLWETVEFLLKKTGVIGGLENATD